MCIIGKDIVKNWFLDNGGINLPKNVSPIKYNTKYTYMHPRNSQVIIFDHENRGADTLFVT